ncbi:WD-REPEATS-REGION domain-containing protein [Aphelenchoides besseyi]|nr:WD-REPEATS-REGION domain-containing protein [Aphelenchoides besseyi]
MKEESKLVGITKKDLKRRDVDDVEELDPTRVRTKLHVKKITQKKERLRERVERKARAEILNQQKEGFLATEDKTPTYLVKQQEIVDSVDVATATKHFNLDLDHGPYKADYTTNGRHLLLGGRDGHLAAFDWLTKSLHTEISINEKVNAVKWLHNENMFAAAQKRWTYIYDRNGTELHCIKSLFDVHSLEFLPRHFLLVGLSNTDFLSYLDVSTGKLVSSQRIKQKNTTCMAQNPSNAIVVSGNTKGVICLWAPNINEGLVEMLAHKSPISGVAIDRTGTYMATTSLDSQLKIWDMRMYSELSTYKMTMPATHVAFSQKQCVAVAFGRDVHLYNDACTGVIGQPYMRYSPASAISCLRFCPYEDVLGIGHTNGFSSILVPGSGDPNFDALQANPFESKKQRQEREVRQLLEKIQPNMITLDPTDINRVNQEALKKNITYRDEVMHWKNTNVNKMLVGREAEVGQLMELIELWFQDQHPQSICIKGVPGTGKTAAVKSVVESLPNPFRKKNKFTYVYVNCLGISKQTDFCIEIYDHLNKLKSSKKLGPQNAMKEAETLLFASRIILVLDEVDSLTQMNATLLSRVFGWPLKSGGNVLLIAISNSLDLIERHLKRNPTPPEMIMFRAYTSDQIEAILRHKFAKDYSDIEENAFKLCAKKVATQTGDIRRAITIIDEMIKMRPPTDENRNESFSTPTKKRPRLDSANSTPSTPRTPSSACRDVLTLFNHVTASPIVRVHLPLKQKIVLACVLHLLKSSTNQSKRLTIKRTQLFEMYKLVCQKQKIETFDLNVFDGIDDSLDFLKMNGMIDVKKDTITVYVDIEAAQKKISDSSLIQSVSDIFVKV